MSATTIRWVLPPFGTMWAMRPPPKLSVHKATGVHCVTWKGRRIYFSKDASESHKEYAKWIASVWAPAAAAMPSKQDHREDRLLELTELYLSDVRLTKSHALMSSYRSYLKPALAFKHGSASRLRVNDITPQFLHALSHDMLANGYMPRSVNHTLKAVARMIRWAEDQELVQSSRLPSRIKLVPVQKPQPRASAPSVVVEWLRESQEKDPRLTPWLALNYLAVLRPSELPRVVGGHGEWIAEGVLAIEGKSTHKTGLPRYVLMSPEAKEWLAVAEPCWKTWQSYSARVREKCRFGGPRRLRAWAATHLRQQGVPLPDVRVALGHSESGAVVHYVESDFSAALTGLDRITVRPVSPCSPCLPPV